MCKTSLESRFSFEIFQYFTPFFSFFFFLTWSGGTFFENERTSGHNDGKAAANSSLRKSSKILYFLTASKDLLVIVNVAASLGGFLGLKKMAETGQKMKSRLTIKVQSSFSALFAPSSPYSLYFRA